MNEIVVGELYWLTHEATAAFGCQIVEVVCKLGGQRLQISQTFPPVRETEPFEVHLSDISEVCQEEVAHVR